MDATSIQGVTVSATTPTTGQVIEYNGTEYAPATVGSTSISTIEYLLPSALTTLLSITPTANAIVRVSCYLRTTSATSTTPTVAVVFTDSSGAVITDYPIFVNIGTTLAAWEGGNSIAGATGFAGISAVYEVEAGTTLSVQGSATVANVMLSAVIEQIA